jgi:acetyltransferase
VAIVGASLDPEKVGNVLLNNLLLYRGDVVPIHPSEPSFFGRRAYPTLRDAPHPIDLAVVVTPPATVPGVLEDCVGARVQVALVITGGFAEIGPEGAELQARAVAVARRGGVRVLGPNCFGVVNVHQGLNASLGLGLPAPGGVSLFTQSGAYGMAATSRSQEGSIGFAKVIAAGNTADLDASDVVAFLAEDLDTRVIALFLESVGDGAALVKAARRAAAQKPVVAALVGRREAGRRAAASHTAALVGSVEVAAAVLRQAGVRVVPDGHTLFDAAAALDRQGPLRGRRVAVITNSGGTGVELADLLEEAGLEVPRLSPALAGAVAAELPPHGSALNPIDVTTDWKRFPAMYGGCLALLQRSDEVDAVVPVLLQRSALSAATCDAVAASPPGKPVHVLWVAPDAAAANRARLLAAGIPCHDSAAHAARVLAACRDIEARPPPPPEAPLPVPDQIGPGGWLPLDAALAWLAAARLPVAPYRVVGDADEAAEVADSVGATVVLKAIRPGVVHKTEAGALRLGLRGPDAVRAAARELGPGPLLVQAQAPAGVELLVGAVRDARFGPVVVVGLGGVFAEALGDVARRLAPFDAAEADDAWSELRGAAVLEGWRGGPPVDRRVLSSVTARVSALVARAPWLRELDLNPIIAGTWGAIIVDARVRVAQEQP